MKIVSKYYIAIAIAGILLLWWVWKKYSENAPLDTIIDPSNTGGGNTSGGNTGGGNTGGGNTGGGNTGGGNTGGGNAPSTVPFVDFAAMRFIGNDGRRSNNSRRIIDPLYSATGFLVPASYDISAFTVGSPVRIEPTPLSEPTLNGGAGREALSLQLLLASISPDVHYETGIKEILRVIPAIPGHGGEIRGHWIVTDAAWTNGSTKPEPGTLTIL